MPLQKKFFKLYKICLIKTKATYMEICSTVVVTAECMAVGVLAGFTSWDQSERLLTLWKKGVCDRKIKALVTQSRIILRRMARGLRRMN